MNRCEIRFRQEVRVKYILLAGPNLQGHFPFSIKKKAYETYFIVLTIIQNKMVKQFL